MFNNIYNDIDSKNIDNIYDVANVKTGFNYWFFKLLNICLSMFDYDNLPTTLPKREIELNLLLTGHCVIFKDNNGDIRTANTNIYGYDVYYNPTKAIYANPLLEYKKLNIGMNCEVVYNNSLKDNISYIPCDGGLRSFIYRYSRLLSDIESSIDIYLVNSRLTSYPIASNDKVANSIKSFFKKLKSGQFSIISDDAIIQEFRNVDVNRTNIHDGINDLLIARDKILEMFFRDIGIKMYNPKKAQITEEEISVNNQLLLISKDDMEKERLEGFKRVNKMFNLNIIPYINPNFNIERFKSEVTKNEY